MVPSVAKATTKREESEIFISSHCADVNTTNGANVKGRVVGGER